MLKIKPKNHAEAIALFRASIVGALSARDLSRGDLKAELQTLSRVALRPPGSDVTRTFSVSTLERWYYAYRAEGLDGLLPQRSRDGFARALSSETKALIAAIAEENTKVPVSVILKTLRDETRLAKDLVSDNTIRRYLAALGLDAAARRHKTHGKMRRRWVAHAPGVLWHADVCHGPALTIDGRSRPLRIHGILDDASRMIIGLRAFHTELEVDMLSIFVDALRQHGKPTTLYLDNGSTYRGEALALACHRLGIKLVHAQAYDPEARGKMERFWRTARAGCIDHLGGLGSLHDVQARLIAFLDRHYLPAPHSSLLGRCPADVYATDRIDATPLTNDALRDALTARSQRRVRKDGTVSVGGIDWEVDDGYLAGRRVTVARSLFEPQASPWIEYEDRNLALRRVDAVANGLRVRKRSKQKRKGIDAIHFDPATAALKAHLGGER